MSAAKKSSATRAGKFVDKRRIRNFTEEVSLEIEISACWAMVFSRA